jgi:serine/threonine protein kinase
LNVRQRLILFKAVCQAIQHAHAKGVVHRDIKPGNVLVAMYDDQPIAKVIDFGIAKAMGQQLTQKTLHTGFGAVVGSLEYMSPEQASFNQLDIDTRTDVYSLGVLLYELLTGAPPLRPEDLRRAGLLESLRMIRETEPPRPSLQLTTIEGLPSVAAQRGIEPSRLAAMVRGDLDWIVMKALEKDRNRRYETASNLADDLERYLNGEAVRAHPPGSVYLLRKFLVRNKVAASIMALIVTFVALTSATWAFQAQLRSRQIQAHSRRVTKAIDEGSRALSLALNAPIGQNTSWVEARSTADRILG